MEMFAAAQTIRTAQEAAPPQICEADVARISRAHFLNTIAYYQITNIVPVALIALCSLNLPDWRLMTLFLLGNVATLLGMNVVSRAMRCDQTRAREALLWRVYEVLALLSGVFWSACMLPVITTLGHDIASMFVCVVVIVSIAVTCMVVASERRLVAFFLFGALVCLVPQTIVHMAEIGPIPLAATIGLGPALIGLAAAVRKQNHLMIRTQLEKQHLANSLSHALAAAEYLASRDSLTGLYNRRAFEELALNARAADPDAPFSMILVDLDHFKVINDRYGHGMGDAVLVRAAEMIADHVGPHDVVGRGDGAIARWGGEEFIILLGNCPLAKAVQIAHDLRQGLAAMRGIDWPEGLVTTGSLGVVPWDPDLALHACIGRADEAMYRAKNGGRNRVSVYRRSNAADLVATYP